MSKTHPAVEAVARAISKLSDCEYCHPVDAYCDCRNQATAAIRALLDVPVSKDMISSGYAVQDNLNFDTNSDPHSIFRVMLRQLVREIENDSIQT